MPVTSVGTARNGVPRVPVAASTAATNSGPIAKPALPPTENTLIACWLSPLAARPDSPMPVPATVRPAGTSQRRLRRSVRAPKTGWITDDKAVAANVSPVAAA